MIRIFITRRRLQAFVIVSGLLFFASMLAFDADAQGKAKPKPKKVNVGAVYAANCARCHGADGKGTGLGRSLDTPDLTDADFQKGLSSSRIRRVILNGDGGMPGFKSKLPAAEVTALTSYIRTFKGK